jgi:hypothetical protein
MKIALVLDRSFDEVAYAETTHIMDLANLLDDAGHLVTILTTEAIEYEGNNKIVVEDILDQGTYWRKAEAIHGWLLSNPQDLLYGFSRGGLFLVEQMVGNTPTIVRPATSLLDTAMAGKFEVGAVPDVYFGATNRQYGWSVHSMEMASIGAANLVVGHGTNFAIQAKSIGNPRTFQLPLPIEQRKGVIPDGEGILVMAGGHSYLKGCDLIPGLVNTIPANIPVDIVGTQWKAEDFSRPVDVSDRPLERPDLEQMYMNCEAVLIPARTSGTGLAILEAFSFGKPVICFDPADPSRNGWPLWRLGHPNVIDRSSIPKILEASRKNNEEMVKYKNTLWDFASQFDWAKLKPVYEEAFELAVANAVTQGRTNRGW